MKRRARLTLDRGGPAHPTEQRPRTAPPYGRGVWDCDLEFDGQRCFKAVNKNGAVIAMARTEMNLPNLDCVPLINVLRSLLDECDPITPDLSLEQPTSRKRRTK
jgi:hypothetical protein